MPNQGRQSRDFLDRKGLDNQRSNATSTDSNFRTLGRRRATNLIVASPFSFRSMNPSCCQSFKSALLLHPGYASGIPVLFARFQAGSNQCRRISAATSWSPQSSHYPLDSLAILIANQEPFLIERQLPRVQKDRPGWMRPVFVMLDNDSRMDQFGC